MNDTRTTKRSRALLTMRRYDENVARKDQAGALCRLQTVESRVTADIRKELARLEDERRLESGILLHCEAALLDAHRARKSADQHHRRVVRMIALKRAAELDNQAGAASSPYADGPYDSLEQTDVY